jgi:hypothetical protein
MTTTCCYLRGIPSGVRLNVSESKTDTKRMSPDSKMREYSRKLVNHELEAETNKL